MPLDPTILDALSARCAPAVAAQTLQAVARVESGFEPLAIGVNGPRPYRIVPRTLNEAVRDASQLIAAGANVDLGLLQINSKNLGSLRLSLAAVFEPCQNLHAAGRLLQVGYSRGGPSRVGEQAALRIALSYYNTGRPDRGFRNGYVARVLGISPPPVAAAVRPAAEPIAPPAWDVFATAAPVSVFLPDSLASGAPR